MGDRTETELRLTYLPNNEKFLIVSLREPEYTANTSRFRGIDPTTPCVARPFALRGPDERNADKLTASSQQSSRPAILCHL